jgi:hypothetical protein
LRLAYALASAVSWLQALATWPGFIFFTGHFFSVGVSKIKKNKDFAVILGIILLSIKRKLILSGMRLFASRSQGDDRYF